MRYAYSRGFRRALRSLTTLFVGVAFLTIAVSVIYSIAPRAHAALQQDSSPSISLSAPSYHDIGTLAPANNGSILSNELIVSVGTNNPTGYDVGINMSTTDVCLKPSDRTSDSCASLLPNREKISQLQAPSLDLNQWGISIDAGSSWLAIPASDQTTQLVDTYDHAANSRETNLLVAAKADLQLSPGVYNGTVTITAIAHSVPAPTIESVAPNSGPTMGGTTVLITGTNLSTVYNMTVGGLPCQSTTIESDTTISCVTPKHDVGLVDIDLASWGGNASLTDAFEYIPPEDVWIKADSSKVNGDSSSYIQIDKDTGLIPVVNRQSDGGHTAQTEWANYDTQKWANAVAIKKDMLHVYQSAPVGTIIQDEDILAFYVYIPRYAYQVMRYDPNNFVICGDGSASSTQCSSQNLSATEFQIRFQKASDQKLMPVSNTEAVDYRQAVDGDQRWYTHPAFTVGNTELNGIWIGKYETSKSTIATSNNNYTVDELDLDPIIKPNSFSRRFQSVSNQYATAKQAEMYHNIDTNITEARLLRNLDWGAMAYLSTSQYGRSTDEVYINNCWSNSGGSTAPRYVTGIAGNSASESYLDPAATCYNSTSIDSIPTSNQYYGATGVHASATDNVYGIYDISGGARENTLSNWGTGNNGTPGLSGFTQGTDEEYFAGIPNRYFDIYPGAQFDSDVYANNDRCTFETCAGSSTYEVSGARPVAGYGNYWNSDASYFVASDLQWASRGGFFGNTQYTGIFAGDRDNGGAAQYYGSRLVLNSVSSGVESFSFTIDTGPDSTFAIPTSGQVNAVDNHSYSWDISWGDNQVAHVTGVGGTSSSGITHNYTAPGRYQITIKSHGDAEAGWLDAFGFMSNVSGANIQSNKDKFISIDSPLSRLARTPGTSNRFANMFYGARNAVSIPADLFRYIALSSSETNLTGLFYQTFANYAYNSTTATIPSGLFASFDTSHATNLSSVFYSTFSAFAYNSTVATIPANLFSSFKTTNATSLSGTFTYTFQNAAYRSNNGSIPAGLFSGVTAQQAISISYLFFGTFYNYAYSSQSGSIPANLFANLSVPSTTTQYSSLFGLTFAGFAYNNTSASIPGGLFSSIDTTYATALNSLFYGTFNNYAYSSQSGTIPANLFNTIATPAGQNFSAIFQNTFSGYARNSSIGVIPGSLFGSITTENATVMDNMFNSTFSNYAYSSNTAIPNTLFSTITIPTGVSNLSGFFQSAFNNFAHSATNATIPSALFSTIDTSHATNLSTFFNGTFNAHAGESTAATIPEGLFDSISTSSAENISNMYSGAFTSYGDKSTVGTIPSGLFSGLDMTNTTNANSLFQFTFYNYATRSTVGVIPDNLFDNVDTTSTTANINAIFNHTFYACYSAGLSVNPSNIEAIFGSAILAGFTPENIGGTSGGLLYRAFGSNPTLTGRAQVFIDDHLNGTVPDQPANAFTGTGVSDFGLLDPNWQ